MRKLKLNEPHGNWRLTVVQSECKPMFTLYKTDNRNALKTIPDRLCSHLAHWSSTISLMITSWNAPIPKVARSESDRFLERSAPNVSGCFQSLEPGQIKTRAAHSDQILRKVCYERGKDAASTEQFEELGPDGSSVQDKLLKFNSVPTRKAVVFIRWNMDRWIAIFGGKSAADDHIG